MQDHSGPRVLARVTNLLVEVGSPLGSGRGVVDLAETPPEEPGEVRTDNRQPLRRYGGDRRVEDGLLLVQQHPLDLTNAATPELVSNAIRLYDAAQPASGGIESSTSTHRRSPDGKPSRSKPRITKASA